MTDLTTPPPEALTLEELDGLAHRAACHSLGEVLLVDVRDLRGLVTLARRALVTEPVVEACQAMARANGTCPLCRMSAEHHKKCPLLVMATTITRSGARTEGGGK